MSNRYFLTAGRILNDVAIDVGLESSSDPVASTEKQFVQLTRQLSIAIEELAEVHEWEQFKREHTFTTDDSVAGPPDQTIGEYALPADFHYMIDQTQWDRSNDVPLGGPMSSQDWQYLLGRDLVSSTIYASFRQQEGVLALWPKPPADGLVIAFEYASTNWIRNAADSAYIKVIEDQADVIWMAPSLLRAYLKAKYLGSKGFSNIDATTAVAYFLNSAGGKNGGAPTLSVGGGKRNRYPYLEQGRNLPDTGYGS